ncbi:MAG: 2-oxoacid:ferredoxin oxidoreductase subunit alpha [Promethearchaeota archaeon]|nr:MAG: 2-oxoacid:ferredoxin oxidoreductase subunit alpha [Candidatus Lokiarchaeota archaeon]
MANQKDTFTYIVGGKAGEGVKKSGSIAAKLFTKLGRYIFQRDDYMSLIQGGHNYSVVTTANRWVSSQYENDVELIVNSDDRSYNKHKHKLSQNGIIVFNSDKQKDVSGFGVPFSSKAKDYKAKSLMFGVGALAVLTSVTGQTKAILEEIIKEELPEKTWEDNIAYASDIYDHVDSEIGSSFKLEPGDKKRPILTGNESLSLGAIAAGLDCYYAYPMTPSSSILHFLAQHQKEFNLTVVQPENEIAVINMAIGSSFSGAKTMIASSGGGYALMNEGYSLAGMCEAPLVVVLTSRPSPASGVPTYTEQGDLQFALNSGHGDFLRIVASPASIEEAFYLTNELFDLTYQYQTPAILLTSKHLSESHMTVDLTLENTKWAQPKLFEENGEYKRYLDTENGVSPMKFPPSEQLIKWNSYEHDELGITTEDPEITAKMHDKRYKKEEAMIKQMKNMHTVNTFGDSGPLIFTWGSTTMSVLEALEYGNIDATVVQPIYLRPFPVWELEKYRSESVTTVELNKWGQFTTLIKEKTQIRVKKLINQYNARPFDPIVLSKKLNEVL